MHDLMQQARPRSPVFSSFLLICYTGNGPEYREFGICMGGLFFFLIAEAFLNPEAS